ncbi:methyl-accepting chemotaxis protein [Argonema antarcticum]|uniref:methyl-accepting chemotaxis protein n=1 Tax=Argonema antarcticum TaxID=2942763 RepID=UPI0020121603|nr:methyl-accepting chemotaxis protein [Argonema antarcticum]MCL1475228.1 methyl-accepting chemotaxis protein [Argonema antarcticum A004/B2]
MVSSKEAAPTLLKFRLRTTLVVPFVLQIVGTVGLVGYLSFQNGQKAVNDLARQLRSEVTARIGAELRTYLGSPHDFNRLNAVRFSEGSFDMVKASNAKQFLTQVEISPFVYSAYCGDSQGQYLGAYRLLYQASSTIAMSVSNAETNYNFYFYAMDIQGNRQRLLQKLKPYDPRKRPWYIAAVKAKRGIWSEVYLDFASGLPTITASEPVYDSSGKVVGVCATDVVLLEDLRKFLASLSISKTGQAFLIDRSGFVLSSSTDEPLKVGEGENAKLLVATESKTPLVRETARYLQQQFGKFERIERAQQLDYLLQGERQFVQVLPLSDGRGIDWLIVVVVPEADFMEQINANTRITILLCLLGLVVAIVVAILTANWITRPLKQIAKASQDMASSNFNQNVEPSQIIELEQLANSFNDMAGQLKNSFDKLNSVIAQANQVGMKVTASTTQIAVSGKQLEATVIQQAASTNEVNATAISIAATSGELVKRMETITQQAQATAEATSNSQANLQEMASTMDQLATATTSISSRLGVMNEKANNINSVVTAITKVADQTNLLSLNASIEAEKAGEYGAGFAVVAREVRWLADKAAQAAQEIEQMVQEIQSSVASGVMEMDKFSFQVSNHIEQVGRISGQIASAIEQVQSLTPQFEIVSHSMEDQFEGARQISSAIAQLSQASQQTVESLQETNRVLDQLNDTTQVLQGIISSSVA